MKCSVGSAPGMTGYDAEHLEYQNHHQSYRQHMEMKCLRK